MQKILRRVKPIKTMCNEVETVNKFCCLGDQLNFNGGYEAAKTARMRLCWMKFKECAELLLGKRYSLKIKARIYQICIRSVMLYESKT